MGFPPQYHNDGSGRDTFINHAGAYWLNPLPGGTYYKSRRDDDDDSDANATAAVSSRALAASIDPFASVRLSGRALLGQSRYGTTILPASNDDDDDNNNNKSKTRHGDDAAAARGDGEHDNAAADATTTACATDTQPAVSGHVNDNNDAPFDAHATALACLPYDVPRPERRCMQPGHHTTGLESTHGVTFAGAPHTAWTPPREVDSTLLRLAPTYESTCHYGLRTGRAYTDDAAPPHSRTLPDKGVTWGKSRYM